MHKQTKIQANLFDEAIRDAVTEPEQKDVHPELRQAMIDGMIAQRDELLKLIEVEDD